MRHVEMLGVPASGKSTLAEGLWSRHGIATYEGLVDRLRLRPWEATRPRRTVRHLLGDTTCARIRRGPTPHEGHLVDFISDQPRVSASTLSALAQVPDARQRRYAARLWSTTWKELGFAQAMADPAEPVIFHEGLVMRLLTAVVRIPDDARAETAIGDFIDAMPRISGFVHVDVPPNIAEERRAARARRPVHVEGDRFDARLHSILCGLRGRDVPITTVDGTGDPDTSVDLIAGFVRQVTSQSAPGTV